MNVSSPLSDITHVIELAIAPVFLLTALGTVLGVLNTRLSRIVDRARALTDRLATTPEPRHRAYEKELHLLGRRRRLVNAAFIFATLAALLVCLLIVTAFVAAFAGAEISYLLALLFIAAMLAFVGALLTFLREILLAVASVRLEPP